MSHHSQAVSSHSHARSSLNHSQSHRSHSLSQNSHPAFTYSHAPFTQLGPGSCAHSERSHASSYGPPGLPPPYCLARLAPKTSVSSSTPPGAPPGRELAAVPPELTASRQSFQHAMGNPCEFFVDIMWQDSAFQNPSSTKRLSPLNPCRLLLSSLSILCLSDCLWAQDVDTAWPSTDSPAVCLSLWCPSKGIQAASAQREGFLPHTQARLFCGPFVLTWCVQFVKREWYSVWWFFYAAMQTFLGVRAQLRRHTVLQDLSSWLGLDLNPPDLDQQLHRNSRNISLSLELGIDLLTHICVCWCNFAHYTKPLAPMSFILWRCHWPV